MSKRLRPPSSDAVGCLCVCHGMLVCVCVCVCERIFVARLLLTSANASHTDQPGREGLRAQSCKFQAGFQGLISIGFIEENT